MVIKWLIGSAAAMVLALAAAVTGSFATKAKTLTPVPSAEEAKCCADAQPCCTVEDCCPECLACCAEDGCCWECIECCIEMGCDPSCCFPAPTVKAEASKKEEACCPVSKGCAQPAKKQAKGCCGDGCCK